MLRFARTLLLGALLASISATPLAASGPETVPGTWRKLAPEPFAIEQGQASVWTGRSLVVLGRKPVGKGPAVDVAEAYDSARDSWSRLNPPAGPDYVPGYKAVWTGKLMLAFDPFHSVAYDPGTNVWRELPRAVPTGIVVWAGRAAIGWGGGCCGDASSDGAAYNPTARSYRKLPRSPLAPSQGPVGAWTGRELVLLVDGIDPASGKPFPARLSRAAAYDPARNTWRRIAPFPARGVGTAVWDGRELLVVAAGPAARSAYAYNPRSDSWRRLASLPAPRVGATAIWTGERLILWGGQNRTASLPGGLRDGLVYDPGSNRWSAIPRAPLRSSGSAVAWTGRSLLVCGGLIGATEATNNRVLHLRQCAAFTPRS